MHDVCDVKKAALEVLNLYRGTDELNFISGSVICLRFKGVPCRVY